MLSRDDVNQKQRIFNSPTPQAPGTVSSLLGVGFIQVPWPGSGEQIREQTCSWGQAEMWLKWSAVCAGQSPAAGPILHLTWAVCPQLLAGDWCRVGWSWSWSVPNEPLHNFFPSSCSPGRRHMSRSKVPFARYVIPHSWLFLGWVSH